MDQGMLDAVIEKLPALVQMAERTYTEPGRGEDKLNVVLQAIIVMVPAEKLGEFMQKTWPTLKFYVSSLVEFYSFVGFFKSRKSMTR